MTKFCIAAGVAVSIASTIFVLAWVTVLPTIGVLALMGRFH